MYPASQVGCQEALSVHHLKRIALLSHRIVLFIIVQTRRGWSRRRGWTTPSPPVALNAEAFSTTLRGCPEEALVQDTGNACRWRQVLNQMLYLAVRFVECSLPLCLPHLILWLMIIVIRNLGPVRIPAALIVAYAQVV